MLHNKKWLQFKGKLSLRQFLVIGSPLKAIRNRVLFDLKNFPFLFSKCLNSCLDFLVEANFKIYDVTAW